MHILETVFTLILSTELRILLISFIIYTVYITVSRLYFHPIAHFPGPKLAAASFWYEFYYDVICEGRYTFKILELHERYGPVVRINPYELHFSDPEFYDEIYAGGGRKRDKWFWATKALGTPNSSLTTVDHDLHRIRRSAIGKFFSKGNVRGLQPLINDKIEKLMSRFEDSKISGEVMIANHFFAAFTSDVVIKYAFGKEANRLEHANFEPVFQQRLAGGAGMANVLKQMFWIRQLVDCLPDWLTIRMNHPISLFVVELRKVERQVRDVINDRSKNYQIMPHPTIYHEIMNSKLPPPERTLKRLADEATTTVGAGTLSTAWTLTLALYYILRSPSVLKTLKREISSASPNNLDIPSLATLENLPYLSAVVKEALRFNYGAAGRLARIPTQETLNFDDGNRTWVIPPGTPCSMSQMHIHHNSKIFSDSHQFIPDRWIADPQLGKFLLTFSKGSRNCAGMNLAYAELYISIFVIFRRYGSKEVRMKEDLGVLEMWETTDRDVVMEHDMFVPSPWKGSKGVRIRVLC